jgi:hypothetical protein
LPQGSFGFAVIGLNNGRPFTTNDCFSIQYAWARQAEAHPDVYINLDFPRPGNENAESGPYGTCPPEDDWCRGYNYGYALANDSIARARALGVSPRRYWFDVEMANHWSDVSRDNAQVVRGALDRFRALGVPIGIYGTRYQWGLITDGFAAPGTPLWVAGAEHGSDAIARCDDQSFAFAGGEIWMVQYEFNGYDGNYRCPRAEPVGKPEPRIAEPQVPRSPLSPTSTAPKPTSPGLAPGAPWRDFSPADIKRLFGN